MGRIVGGFGASHVLFPPDGVDAHAERAIDGMLEIRRRIKALAPDLMVLASADNLNNFTLAQQITLAVGIADHFDSLGDGGVPPRRFAGERVFFWASLAWPHAGAMTWCRRRRCAPTMA